MGPCLTLGGSPASLAFIYPPQESCPKLGQERQPLARDQSWAPSLWFQISPAAAPASCSRLVCCRVYLLMQQIHLKFQPILGHLLSVLTRHKCLDVDPCLYSDPAYSVSCWPTENLELHKLSSYLRVLHWSLMAPPLYFLTLILLSVSVVIVLTPSRDSTSKSIKISNHIIISVNLPNSCSQALLSTTWHWHSVISF